MNTTEQWYADQTALPPSQIIKKEAAPITTPQRWLLLGALAIGFCVQLFCCGVDSDFSLVATYYAAIWLTYLLVFHIFCKGAAKTRLIALPLAVTAAFLCCMMVAQANGYSDDALSFINLLAIPCLLMLHAQAVTQPLPKEKEANYIPLFFFGFFAQPFVHIARFFAAIGSLFKKQGQSRLVWIGLLITIPVAGVVLALLLQADAVMNAYASSLFSILQLGTLFLRGFLIFLSAMLFYSFLYGAAFAKPYAIKDTAITKWQATAPRIVVGALLVIYAVFTAVQFLYLFGGYGLPAELTYAEYARQGFSQLIWVAAINLAVFAVCLCRIQEDKLLRSLLVALLVATGIILASSFTRLGMYIEAYGLTFKRIQAFWMLSYISGVIILAGVRLFRKQLPLLRICVLFLVLWYAALNIPDLTRLYMR